MRKDKIMTEEESNIIITNIFDEKDTFLIGRIGIGGESATSAIVMSGQLPDDRVKFWLYNTAGFYGPPDFYRFAKLYADACRNEDYHAYWGFPGFVEIEDYLVPEETTLIHPSALESFRFDNPWTKKLSGKKVLIVHPFKTTIDQQIQKRDKIWKNQNILPEAEYITYQSVQSLGGRGPHRDWYESFERMCDDISKIDFDYALMACGAYGMPLANFVKTNLKKGAIYVGGGLQLYFGINGNRWSQDSVILPSINDHWVRHKPTQNDSPDFNHYVPERPGGDYW
jgi:hypothetical protein